LSLEITVL